MVDREKVIKGLECHAKAIGCRKYCPYWSIEKIDCSIELADDALALLKEKEPIEPVFERRFMTSIEIYDCGKCGTSLGAKGIAKYCMKCGQAVKWE